MRKPLLFLVLLLSSATAAAPLPNDRVSKAGALQDVDQFFATLKRVHPDLLRHESEESYRKLKQQTAADIIAHLDSQERIGIPDLAAILYYAAAYFKDGHTSVDWVPSLDESNTRGKRFPAFALRFDNGHFVIAAATNRAITGAELVAVNGVPVLEFLQPVLDRCSGETLPARAARFLGDEPLWYYLTNLLRPGVPYILKLRDPGGAYREMALETLDFAEYVAFRFPDGSQPFRPNRQGTSVEFFDSGSTAHFMYSSFAPSAAEKKKVDGVFEEVRAKGARNLILDVRGNPGGDSSMAECIFRYLYAGKFRAMSKVRARASRDVLGQVPWPARPLVFLLSGRVVGFSPAEHSYAKPAAFFPGRVYLLIDNGSFSMAAGFAAMFRDYKVGTILGYETGGLPITFGGPHRFTLKNSRIPCSVAWTQQFPPRPRPGDDEHGVIPDVPLGDRELSDLESAQDPVLAYTLRYIRRGEATPVAPQR